jgi:hypothetical protein
LTQRRSQVNVPLDEELVDVVAMFVARDHSSAGTVLRTPEKAYLRRRVKQDPDIAMAVESIRRSRAAESDRRARKSGHAEITALPMAPPKKAARRSQWRDTQS